MKVLPYTSLRLIYFIPLIFALGVLFGYLPGIIYPSFILVYLGLLALYFIVMLVEAARSIHISAIPLFVLIGFLTHMTYGIGVILGLLMPSLQSKLKPKHES